MTNKSSSEGTCRYDLIIIVHVCVSEFVRIGESTE